jgi:outer membrane PBP1 activator LpoA protein
MNGTEKMQSAQSQLLAAQIAIAAEQFEALQEQLKVAKGHPAVHLAEDPRYQLKRRSRRL